MTETDETVLLEHVDSSEMEPTEAPEVTDAMVMEAMAPELSEDEFTLCGKTIKIMPLKVKHEQVLQRKLAALHNELTNALVTGDSKLIEALAKNTDVAIEIVTTLAENSDVKITKNDILDQREVDTVELANIVVRYGKKCRALQGVLDFFEQRLLPKVTEVLALGGEKLLSDLEFQADLLRPSTSSSSPSASDTDGPSTTSST